MQPLIESWLNYIKMNYVNFISLECCTAGIYFKCILLGRNKVQSTVPAFNDVCSLIINPAAEKSLYSSV